MSLLQDLDDYKFETAFQQDPIRVVHTSYKADPAKGLRKVRVVDEWVPLGSELGVGSFGTVRLEQRVGKADDGKLSLRAVKQLRKSYMERLNVDFKNELLALTKFSRSKVNNIMGR